MHSLTRPGRLAGIALALSLVAAACGSETDSVDVASEGSAPETSALSTADAETPASESEEPAAPGSDEDDETAAPVENHSFPDLDTVNIVDGASLNLAQELAGGDTPVLLWFWAPH